MAVSGRKVSKFRDSVSKGSAEAFDHLCEPCLTTGQHLEAHGLCVDCQEYLCKNCVAYHQRTKASKHHQIQNKYDMDEGDKRDTPKANLCTEHCPLHNMEFIKYFCQTHGTLGCSHCMIMEHRTCKIEYIPEKCIDVMDSEMYKDIMTQLDKEENMVEDVIKRATIKDKEVDTFHDVIIKQLMKFREDIIDRLDNMQREVRREAEEKKSSDKEIVKNVIDICTDISTDIKGRRSMIQETSHQGVQLYIAIKRAEARLKANEIANAKDSLKKANVKYNFDGVKEIDKMIMQMKFVKQNVFEKLWLSTDEKLIFREDIDVRTKSDKETCYITGCAVLSSNMLVLADNHNNKIKVVDTNSKVIVERTLNSLPYDIAVLPQDQIAVTMPKEKEILISTSFTPGKLLSIERKIRVKAQCNGITYHQDNLYVVCVAPSSVLTLDTDGNIHSNILLDSDMFQRPNYVTHSLDTKTIHVSDWGSNSIVSLSSDGYVTAFCKHSDLDRPQGLLLLGDDSLLVCCWNGTIHHISGDLKKGQKILDGLEFPKSLCYNHLKRQVYIGGVSNRVQVLSLKKKSST